MANKQPVFSPKNFYKKSANHQIKNRYLENLKTQIAGIDGGVSRQFMPLAVESLDSALSRQSRIQRLNSQWHKLARNTPINPGNLGFKIF